MIVPYLKLVYSWKVKCSKKISGLWGLLLADNLLILILFWNCIWKHQCFFFFQLKNGCSDCHFNLHKKEEKYRTSSMFNLGQISHFLVYSERFCIPCLMFSSGWHPHFYCCPQSAMLPEVNNSLIYFSTSE